MNLLESASGFQPISSLPPEQQEIALAAFEHLANSQLGKPERMGTSMRANPGMFNGMGAFCFLAEHMGDLTHRMAQRYLRQDFYGYTMVLEKVNRGLSYFDSDESLKDNIARNIKGNFNVRQEENPDLQFSDFLATFKAGAKAYADAHAALVVYNEAQWHAREAAVSLGNLQFDAFEQHLKALEKHLENEKTWVAYASLVMMNGDTIKAFNP